MSYCGKCGAKIDEGNQFCSKCGTSIMGSSMHNEPTSIRNNATNVIHEKQPSQGTGTLVLGILAILLDCCTCVVFPLGFIVIILAILGIVFGSKQYKETGSPKAKAGKIISIVALVLLVVCIFVGIGAASVVYYENLPWYEKILYW